MAKQPPKQKPKSSEQREVEKIKKEKKRVVAREAKVKQK